MKVASAGVQNRTFTAARIQRRGRISLHAQMKELKSGWGSKGTRISGKHSFAILLVLYKSHIEILHNTTLTVATEKKRPLLPDMPLGPNAIREEAVVSRLLRSPAAAMFVKSAERY
ncbi:hypothetical protein NDU88_003121 [Pleurodeles waltl]|uniref:Uncharacterized protein n=1 Tax=Pleurodeles waltl TaxID=8319 RepID=A0AAV7SDY1_PLEWA|nr:hypothetical protein NDU88_003121 [Pleurodeles waltl]